MKLKKEKLTQARLKELLDYDPGTGIFSWKVARQRVKGIGSTAGYKSIDGYIIITIDSKRYKAHRLAFLWMESYFPENVIDHRDRDASNNKWANLREVSQQCNLRNCMVAKNNKSGVTGVNWHKQGGKWRSSIMISGKKIHLGFFKEKHEAVRSRWQAEKDNSFPNCYTTSSAYQYLQARQPGDDPVTVRRPYVKRGFCNKGVQKDDN